MRSSHPLHYIWWLASRASGVVALVLITLSVLMGLAMASRTLSPPSIKRTVARLHEHVALSGLGAVAIHGLTLLGDRWLRPGLRGIAIPFAMSYRPAFTGLGVIAGYLAVLVGPSFYVRRRLGAGRWRKLHRVSAAIWMLSAIHTLGAGSDSSKLWLRVIVLAPTVPLAYLLVLRLLRGRSQRGGRGCASATGAASREKPHSASAPIDTALASRAVAIMPRSGTVSSKNVRAAGTSRPIT